MLKDIARSWGSRHEPKVHIELCQIRGTAW